MNLHLLRHSNATEHPPAGQGDEARPLTAAGRAKCRVIGEAIKRLDLRFDLVLSSPAVRARETAELVLARLKARPPLEFLDALWISGSRAALIRRLKRQPAARAEVLLVGHEPDLGLLVSHLTTGGPHFKATFKKGGFARLAIPRLRDGACASLEWLLTPRQLRLLADG